MRAAAQPVQRGGLDLDLERFLDRFSQCLAEQDADRSAVGDKQQALMAILRHHGFQSAERA